MKKLPLAIALLGLFGLGKMVWAQADQGKVLFQKKMCAACHGAGKKGGDLAASKMDKATMVKFLKDPKSVKANVGMPAARGTDAEITALIDYVMSLRK